MSSTSSVRSSLSRIDKLVRDRQLTKDGRDWLIAAIDPFHDLQLSVHGYPDTNVAGSVVQCVKMSTTIAAPAGVTGNWDCNIFSLPVTADMVLGLADFSIDSPTLHKITAPPGFTFGTLNIISGQTGYDLNVSSIVTGGVTPAPVVSTLSPNAYLAGASRIIASGFEVVNTTADLQKQGTVTVYRVPQTNDPPQTWAISGTGTDGMTGCGSLRNIIDVPSNTADALLLTGTRQWAAREGSYNVVTFSSQVLPIAQDLNEGVVFNTDAPGGRPGTVAASLIEAASFGNDCFHSTCNYTSQNSAGAFFTGLSNQSTLTITHNVYVERFPSTVDTDLVVLAQPSPRYDLIALELYSECLADMPIACMVKDNGLGDWIKNAVSKVSSLAAPVLSMIPHPAAQAGATLARAAQQATSSSRGAITPPSSTTFSDSDMSLLRSLIAQLRAQKKPARPSKA
jgi:hypothetical protein